MRTARKVATLAAAAALGVTGLVGTSIAPPSATTSALVSEAQAASVSGYPLLKVGSKGNSVKVLQKLLNANGAKIDVDGDFGPKTAGAVKSFQKKKKISADGVVGPATWGKIVPTLKSGSSGAKVKALQSTLNLRGAKLDVDGQFGPATKSAVKKAQSKYGIASDGVAGPNTWRVLVTGKGSGGGGGGGSRAAMAKDILNDGGITLLHFCGPSYASPKSNIKDTANGGKASAGGGHVGAKKVYLSKNMLSWMRSYGKSNSYRVTTIVGCSHSSNSKHYRGLAVDIDFANGKKINMTSSGLATARKVMSSCRAAGATEVLGAGDAGHKTHVHCGWSS